MWFAILIAALTSYLLGNLNGSVCISALMKDDVRNHGSGNAGLTNFFRSYGFAGTGLVLLVDMIKTEFIEFPVFNIADCFITCGCILLLISLLFFNKAFWKDEKKK